MSDAKRREKERKESKALSKYLVTKLFRVIYATDVMSSESETKINIHPIYIVLPG